MNAALREIYEVLDPRSYLCAPQDWVRLYDGPETSFKVVRLRPGVRYHARVKASNDIGESLWSDAATFATQASVPDQPAPPVLVSATSESVTLRWQPPHDNGEPISLCGLALTADSDLNPT